MSQTLASGITGAAPIWNRIMTNLIIKHPESKPTMPQNVIQKNCSGKQEYFVKGTEEKVNCSFSPTPSGAGSFERRNRWRLDSF